MGCLLGVDVGFVDGGGCLDDRAVGAWNERGWCDFVLVSSCQDPEDEEFAFLHRFLIRIVTVVFCVERFHPVEGGDGDLWDRCTVEGHDLGRDERWD